MTQKEELQLHGDTKENKTKKKEKNDVQTAYI